METPSHRIDEHDRFAELPDSPKLAPSSTSALAPLSSDSSPSVSAPVRALDNTLEVSGSDSEGGDEHDDDDLLNEDSIWYTPSELRDIIERSTSLKNAGNAAFGRGQLEEAMGLYRDGLVELPVRTVPKLSAARQLLSDDQEDGHDVEVKGVDEEGGKKGEERLGKAASLSVDSSSSDPLPPKEAVHDPDAEQEEEEQEAVRELRSVLYANVAACCIRLKRWKEAVTACDSALEDNPHYVKALSRRATASEAINSWASLSSAQSDHKLLSTLSPSPATTAALKRLPKLIEEQQEKEKTEVLGKLKDLGNTVLGKFGLSTDNFKFTEQPGGGYAFNFER